MLKYILLTLTALCTSTYAQGISHIYRIHQPDNVSSKQLLLVHNANDASYSYTIYVENDSTNPISKITATDSVIDQTSIARDPIAPGTYSGCVFETGPDIVGPGTTVHYLHLYDMMPGNPDKFSGLDVKSDPNSIQYYSITYQKDGSSLVETKQPSEASPTCLGDNLKNGDVCIDTFNASNAPIALPLLYIEGSVDLAVPSLAVGESIKIAQGGRDISGSSALNVSINAINDVQLPSCTFSAMGNPEKYANKKIIFSLGNNNSCTVKVM